MTAKLPGDDCQSVGMWDPEVETASREQTSAMAAVPWDRQLGHLLDDSPFAARKLREAGVGPSGVKLADIANLPFSTKAELQAALEEAPPFGSNAGVPAEHVKRVYQTSGTTGEPSVIILSAADMETWTAIGTRSYFTTGIHDHHAVLSTFAAGPFVAGHTHFVLNRIGCRTVPVSPGDTERVLFAMRAGIVDTLLATPSFAQYLANRELTAGGGGAASLSHVVTGGEPGGGIPAIRDHVQEALGVTVNEVMGIGDIAPSLFGECPLQQGMHFCGTGHIWPELVDPETGASMEIEAGAVGELVYTHLTREAMPLVRFRGGDIVRIEGTSCKCGRTSFRMRCLGRRDDMFIVRGVNVYPAAILEVVGDFRPRVTGRARVVRTGGAVSIDPPVPVEVEIPAGADVGGTLVDDLEAAVRSRLTFRCRVELVPESAFGDSSYKTRLAVNHA